MIDAAELERRMRPGAWSEGGFLGRSERLADVIEADQQTLSELGLTADELATALECLLGATSVHYLEPMDGDPLGEERAARARDTVTSAEQRFGPVERYGFPVELMIDVDPNELIPEDRLLEGALVDGRFEVATVGSPGIQKCPWSPTLYGADSCASGFGSSEWTIRDRKRGLEMRGPELMAHLIREHVFFEGFESPYRVDPRELAELLLMGPFAEETPLS